MIDTYPMSSKDKITVGYSTHVKIVKDLEEQIRILDEKIIQKNEGIMILNKALDSACERLGNESFCCPYTNKKNVGSICRRCKTKCKDAWKHKFLEEVKVECEKI